MDEVVAQMARTRYRMSGTRNLPITIRSPFGGGVHTPELHSDNLEGLIAQSPGIRVVIPSNPYDAKGLLISSIRSNDPVVFLEHMKLYRSFREEVPDEAYEVPLDKAAVTREGTVAPLDVETIIQSVEKTGRVVVVQEAQRQAGVAAQVVSEISERAILSLEAPIGRVSAPDTVFPFGQAENVWLPNAKDIEDKVKEIAEF